MVERREGEAMQTPQGHAATRGGNRTSHCASDTELRVPPTGLAPLREADGKHRCATEDIKGARKFLFSYRDTGCTCKVTKLTEMAKVYDHMISKRHFAGKDV